MNMVGFTALSITGQGIMMYSNGDVYEGEMKKGCVTGCGIKRFANGDKYEVIINVV